MKTPISFLALFLCISLSVFGQKFNRSYTNHQYFDDVMLSGGRFFSTSPGSLNWSEIVKWSDEGKVVARKLMPHDSLRRVVNLIKNESDSTFLISGASFDTTVFWVHDYGFIARLDTALNILELKDIVDSSWNFGTGIQSLPDGKILAFKGAGIYKFNKDFSLNDYYTKDGTHNDFAVPLIGDSVFVQRSGGGSWSYAVIDMGDSVEYAVAGLPGSNTQGNYGSYDSKNDGLCIYDFPSNNGSGVLSFYNKETLSLENSYYLSDTAGFDVSRIEFFEDGIVGTATTGEYIVLQGDFPFTKYIDSVRNEDLTSRSFRYTRTALEGNTIALVSEAESCHRHLEIYPFNQKAETFGEVNLSSSVNSAVITGNARTYTETDTTFYSYEIDASLDVWIKNNSTKTLDSLDILYTAYNGSWSCGRKAAYQNMNLAPADSVMVTITDDFLSYTADSNIADLDIQLVAAAANGNILYPVGINSVNSHFEGMNLKETNLAERIEVYPSPVNDVLNVNLKGSGVINRLTVYSITGQQILTKEIYDTKAPLNVSGLKSGIYILSTEVDGEVYSQRFVKQ
ncbi:hypothetical protein Oweho_1501 [Owenweeksia hongkongensis DSM 17368]|uniref:Secretion system C-terminal sorting domain-containing protein n=1 Tax=Owenweeksia hongkongensis (strain DSM 17368 / CIP 108786 / JCM 12287 / NRRL B-23963 / UST20020801) TaxID=926562 RepID=G8R8R2_OWEHD|nr:T9SS type A sorting domain-containing protein [Owenweeksia hongkongensis]AEV32492.1 hypothetical protein Oweho_1501 [Owenweeksia hongkongensis DSM 17368]